MAGLHDISWGRRVKHLELREADVHQGVGHSLRGAQVHKHRIHCHIVPVADSATRLGLADSRRCMPATGTGTLPSSSLTWRWPSHPIKIQIPSDVIQILAQNVYSIQFQQNLDDENTLEAFRLDVATFRKTRHENLVSITTILLSLNLQIPFQP